jgi:hypothetical protein
MSALGFDTLEDRRLLSHFGGAMSSGREASGGHVDAPSMSFAMISHQSPGGFGGSPRSWIQGQRFPRNGSPPTAGGSLPDQAQQTLASSAGSFQHTDAPPSLSPTLPPAPATSDGTPTGTIAARPTTVAANDNSAFIVTLGADPGTEPPSAAGGGSDQMDGPQPGASSGLAQSVSVFMSLARSALTYSPRWVIVSGPLAPVLQIAVPPVFVVGSIESPSGPAENTSADLPAPRGAGLITDLAAFRHGQIDDQVTRLFDSLREPLEHQAPSYSCLYWTALALAAFEAARRWRRRSTEGPRHSRRFRSSVINGLFSMLP